MRIALLHSFYRSEISSGENAVVRRQFESLTAGGHEVLLLSRSTDAEQRSTFYPIRSAMRVVTGTGADPTSHLDGFRPDVVHVHNMFPNIGETWLAAWDGPLVATMHNFRPLCANSLLFRDGRVCTRCPDGDWLAAVSFGCYRDSRLATIPLAVRSRRGLQGSSLVRRADAVIALSRRSKDIFVKYGVEEARITVLPNGVDALDLAEPGGQREGWVFVGRMTEEKGIRQLLSEWPSNERLTVVGDGPQKALLEAATPDFIEFVGTLSGVEVIEKISSSLGVVVPSLCFENFPTVVSEALATGTPVIGRIGNAAADFVLDHQVGATFSDATELAGALAAVRTGWTSISLHCTRVFEESLSSEAWIRSLTDVYASVLRRVVIH